MLGWFDHTLVIVYLAVHLAVAIFGFRLRNHTREELILAGRQLTLPAFVATLVSTWYGGILGVGEFSYRFGISNWLVFGVPYYLAAAIFAFFLARRARHSPEITIPDRLHKFYGPTAAASGSAVLVLVTMPVAYVLMIGVLFNQLYSVPVWVGIVAGTFFSVCYVMTGGFRAMLMTDSLQFLMMFIGFIVLLVAAVMTYGGLDFLQSHLPTAHFSASGGNSPGYVALWYIIAMATLVEPAFYQRCFAARSEKVARNGILISILFWILFDFLTTFCGMYARAVLPELSNPAAAYPALAAQLLPAGLMGLIILAMMATIMSTVDSYMFLAATTISHDLFWRFKKFEERLLPRYTVYSLFFVSAITITIASLSESVVGIWHDFGSIGTSALLLPVATTYWGKYTFMPWGAAFSIVASAVITTATLLYPRLTGAPGYFLGIEPIFIGLAISFSVFLVTRIEKT